MRKNHSKIVCIKLVHLPYLHSTYISINHKVWTEPLYITQVKVGFWKVKDAFPRRGERMDKWWNGNNVEESGHDLF